MSRGGLKTGTGFIEVVNGRENNLQGIHLRIEKGSFTVVTGVSGSGKSSLVYDTLFKESERLYFSTFPAWSRKYLGVVAKPKVDSITGLDAAVVVDQKGRVAGARSTVGTYSGVLDLLRLLFSRFGSVPPEWKKRPELFNASGTLSRSLFSFNSELGACPACRGLGVKEAIDPELIVADWNRSIRERGLAITAPNGYVIYSQVTLEVLDQVCRRHGFSIDTRLGDLTAEQREALFFGSKQIRVPFGKHTLESRMKWTGITVRPRQEGWYPGFVTVMSEILKRSRNPNVLRFVRSLPCPACRGTRLRPEALAVTWRGRTIDELAGQTIGEAAEFWAAFVPGSAGEAALGGELTGMLASLSRAGLGHVAISRSASTLSGGEVQRIRIAALARSRLRGALYIFDEPTVGLHRAEAREIVRMLLALRDQGNTVLAVEHDLDCLRQADSIVEIGPGGGAGGGKIVFSGPVSEFLESGPRLDSPTWRALTGERQLAAVPPGKGEIVVADAVRHNLKRITVCFRKGAINVITGLSGTGKRSLMAELAGRCEREGRACLAIDSSPIGKTPRSNPATYTGMAEKIRDLFAALPEARQLGLTRSHFSFNSPGGRCEACEGAGAIEIGMKYLGSIEVECDRCRGRRFKPEVLQVRYRGKSISDVYGLSVSQALDFFADSAPIQKRLQIMANLGLDYLQLGRTTASLSGGEAQRVRLAAALSGAAEPAVLMLEEPTAGLHPQDTWKLTAELSRLAGQGHTVVAIEHDLDFIAAAHHLVELGPKPGKQGGEVLYAGPPAGILGVEGSPTAAALQEHLEPRKRVKAGESRGEYRRAMARELRISGVATHNLKTVDLALTPRTFTVITGVSGSGKTSLVFDTLFPESLRAFLTGTSPFVQSMLRGGRDSCLESSSGLMPPVAVSPRFTPVGPRSTAGTVSGLQEMLRMLYSRAGLLPDGGAAGLAAGDFSFHSRSGACPECGGTGIRLSADPERLISDPGKSFWEGAMAASRAGRFYGEVHGQYLHTLEAVGRELGIDFFLPVGQLPAAAFEAAWNGTGERIYDVEWRYVRGRTRGTHRFRGRWVGFAGLLADEYHRSLGHRNQEELRGLMKEEPCPQCRGRRLRPELLQVTFAGRSIADLGGMEATDLQAFLSDPSGLTPVQRQVWAALEPELTRRLEWLIRLGLGHVALDRATASLSLGERERLKLVRGSLPQLQNLLYILDEPSRGLHPADCRSLVTVIREIVANGNTVVAVEHEPAIIGHADRVVELGPGAGARGGQILFSGTVEALQRAAVSTSRVFRFTGQLRGGSASRAVLFRGARARNLREIDCRLPLGETTVITGVSGSGKTTLLREVMAASLQWGRAVGCRKVEGTPESPHLFFHENRVAAAAGGPATVATLAGIMEPIRKQLAGSEAGRRSGMKVSHFTAEGAGACPACRGSGRIVVSMDFLADSTTACPDCDGQGFRPEILEIRLRGLHIAQILALSVEEAIDFFSEEEKISTPLRQLSRTGLGYLALGQRLSTCSTGEIQRLELARALHAFPRDTPGAHLFFFFDEPSTGLHHADIEKFLELLDQLNRAGHTVAVADHRLQLVCHAHQVIDLGPEGGRHGGRIVFAGSPVGMVERGSGKTAEALRQFCRRPAPS